jgi:hypothetical protein
MLEELPKCKAKDGERTIVVPAEAGPSGSQHLKTLASGFCALQGMRRHDVLLSVLRLPALNADRNRET